MVQKFAWLLIDFLRSKGIYAVADFVETLEVARVGGITKYLTENTQSADFIIIVCTEPFTEEAEMGKWNVWYGFSNKNENDHSELTSSLLVSCNW